MQGLYARILKSLFHHLYHSFAFLYDVVAFLVSGGHWYAWVDQIRHFIRPGDVILEVGFGRGHLQETLQSENFSVFGVDESKQMVRQASNRLGQRSLPIKIIRADVRTLPCKENAFSLIIATFPAEYVFQSQFQREVMRVLTPGGRMVALMGVTFDGRNFPDRFYRWLYQTIFGGKEQIIRERTPNLETMFAFPVQIQKIKIHSRTLFFLTFQNPLV